MATPTRSQTVSTPKPHLSTPNRPMASPRPGTASTTNRPFAHKSPAVKTPASIHGHTHHVSVSSQPSSTPLTTTALHDDLLNLTSPAAALMATLGPTGLTPLGAGADGLGISTNGHDPPGRGGFTPVNPEVERFQRAHWVANLLKTRVAGRGVTREGVERMAQLQGFNTLWDDDNLTIAGNAVDLELNFEALSRDVVKDVSLKLSTSENDEPQLQEGGTKVLKENLAWSQFAEPSLPWTSLSSFESNLHYLRQIDQIENGAPCFSAVNNLYHAFQLIWNAEKQKLNWHATQSHQRRGAIGRPFLDRGSKLGLSLDYWTRRHDPESDSSDDSIQIDPRDLYTVQISCESDTTPTLLPANWVSDQVLSEQTQAASILEADSDTLMPEWQDPTLDSGEPKDPSGTTSDDVAMENPGNSLPSMLSMHFICSLFPQIYLPLNAAAGLRMGFAMLDLDQESTVTYQQALQDYCNRGRSTDPGEHTGERWPRDLPIANATDRSGFRRHSYALHSAQNGAPLWCFPVRTLKFNHPRQLAAALPVLRQYALLWSILQSLVEFPSYPTTASEDMVPPAGSAKVLQIHQRPLKRSNIRNGRHSFQNSTQQNADAIDKETLPVDISLDIISDPSRARLDIFIPLRGTVSRNRQKPFVFLSFEVCSGGSIEVRSLQGVQASGSDDTALKPKVARVLTVTEDIGLVVEWLVEKASSQP
ncbi:uncharacterized protein A1O9_00123 [Exophiala aquamarina CBS 119918]|uniref:Mediator of RNA polymerase II transcription subunit 1 n=1 Tax=Exophiala aquamarina CBS 119918 TaxID=1182545 RepID=A0A072PQJ3_9EURO|nr:uncharacterized protein A1O9_00123 [Exophiala aquamarina CBS 119918]KEF62151.1 hypothetical protein A1O9_00123 [Exophiala aquamarina CBS 119918]